MKRSGFVKHDAKIILKFDISGLQEDTDVQKVTDYFISIAKKMPNKSITGLADFTNLNVTSRTETDIIRLTDQTKHCFTAFAVLVSDAETKQLADKIIDHYSFRGNNIKVFEAIDNAKKWISNVT